MKDDRPAGCAVSPVFVMPLSDQRRSETVNLLKALGDDTRLEIFRLIAGQVEPICVCDIVDRFDVSQPTISHHLRVLKEAGLIRSSRRANWAFYEVNSDGLALAHRTVSAVIPGVLEPA